MNILATAKDHIANQRWAEALAASQQLLKLGMHQPEAQHLAKQAMLKLALQQLSHGQTTSGLHHLKTLTEANPDWWEVKATYIDWQCNTQPMKQWGAILGEITNQSLSPRVALNILGNATLWSWYNRDSAGHQEHLFSQVANLINTCSAHTTDPYEQHELSIARNTLAFLAHLLPHAPAPPVQPNLPKIWAIGDSHVLSSLGQTVEIKGQAYQIDTAIAWGCKAFHLSPHKTNDQKTRFTAQWNHLPENATVLVCLGEIDCRFNEGMWVKRATYPSLLHAAEATFTPMVEWLATNQHQRRIILNGIPAPHPEQVAHIAGPQQREFVGMIVKANYMLQQQAKRHGFGFLDIHTMTNDGRGVGTNTWFLENIHLIPTAIPYALKHHLKYS